MSNSNLHSKHIPSFGTGYLQHRIWQLHDGSHAIRFKRFASLFFVFKGVLRSKFGHRNGALR